MLYMMKVAVSKNKKVKKYLRLIVNASTELESRELVADHVLRKHGSYEFDIVSSIERAESVIETYSTTNN
jgi:hypothetical protein